MATNDLILAIVVALVGAIAPTMVAYSSLRQSQKNAEKTAENTALTAETHKKVEAVEKQTDDIHTATNGASAKMEQNFDAATKEIGELRAIIKSLVDREALAAPVRADTARQTGELVAETDKSNGTLEEMRAEMAELKAIMAGFAEKGMPVVAPDGAPLPVKVEMVSKK